MKGLYATAFAAMLFTVFLLTGCGGTADTTAGEIRLGATAGPHAEVAEAVAREAERQGMKVKVVEFSDYVTPDQALADGDLELNSYQHEPFLQSFNQEKGTELSPIGTTILMRMGIYSDKVHDIASVPEGAKVAIPNDPTNGGRGLVLLEKAGLIRLREGVGFKGTVQDVVENPRHLQFVELEAAQLPRSLSDVDIAAITMNYVMSGGLDVEKQGIFLEDRNEPLAVMILAARAKDKDNPNYRKIAEIFHSDAVKKFIAEQYKGTIIPAE
ncbi:MAG: MetQ/NlpA family ABC transporter substrate-binding protein [Selenomonadaceae bacterium]|nr:MetQ/NlpA family ABC transporter substrate-binding protein [Selenomonadaceae bacterium]